MNARRKAEEARQQIANGIDPSELRKNAKQVKKMAQLNDQRVKEGLPVVNSFADITHQWLASTAHLVTEMTLKKKTSRIERLAFPVLGNLPIKEIKSADILKTLKPTIDKGQFETAHRLHSEISTCAT